MVLAAVLFGQLLLMAYQLRRNEDIPLVRNSVVYLVAPIQRGASGVVRSVRGVWEGYVYLWGTHRQNESLLGQLDKLKMENQRLREQAEQGHRLQVLFDLRQQMPLPTVVAQVLSTGSSETARIVLIDKGDNAGLKPDLPVMVADGVVGKVLHVFPDTAQVLLLTDPYSGVACLLENSRVHGILKGQNKPTALLTYVPNGEQVTAGQKVFTSGEDQIYPKGLPVGVVLDARPGPEFMQVTVQPLASLNRLEEVLVILQSGGDLGQSFMAAGSAASGSGAAAPSPQPQGPAPAVVPPTTPGKIPVATPPTAASAPAPATVAPAAPKPAALPSAAGSGQTPSTPPAALQQPAPTAPAPKPPAPPVGSTQLAPSR
jgi:rod shape-determining protein MreC